MLNVASFNVLRSNISLTQSLQDGFFGSRVTFNQSIIHKENVFSAILLRYLEYVARVRTSD